MLSLTKNIKYYIKKLKINDQTQTTEDIVKTTNTNNDNKKLKYEFYYKILFVFLILLLLIILTLFIIKQGISTTVSGTLGQIFNSLLKNSQTMIEETAQVLRAVEITPEQYEYYEKLRTHFNLLKEKNEEQKDIKLWVFGTVIGMLAVFITFEIFKDFFISHMPNFMKTYFIKQRSETVQKNIVQFMKNSEDDIKNINKELKKHIEEYKKLEFSDEKESVLKEKKENLAIILKNKFLNYVYEIKSSIKIKLAIIKVNNQTSQLYSSIADVSSKLEDELAKTSAKHQELYDKFENFKERVDTGEIKVEKKNYIENVNVTNNRIKNAEYNLKEANKYFEMISANIKNINLCENVSEEALLQVEQQVDTALNSQVYDITEISKYEKNIEIISTAYETINFENILEPKLKQIPNIGMMEESNEKPINVNNSITE